jgi:hypothetical protein
MHITAAGKSPGDRTYDLRKFGTITAAGKSPGDRTYDLRKFSTITDMLQGEKIRRAGLPR